MSNVSGIMKGIVIFIEDCVCYKELLGAALGNTREPSLDQVLGAELWCKGGLMS
jgi:hypothetical protein